MRGQLCWCISIFDEDVLTFFSNKLNWSVDYWYPFRKLFSPELDKTIKVCCTTTDVL